MVFSENNYNYFNDQGLDFDNVKRIFIKIRLYTNENY